MVTDQFEFFFDLVQQKRAGVASRKDAEREREREQLEA